MLCGSLVRDRYKKWEFPSENEDCYQLMVLVMEAWLLADRDGMARLLDISVRHLPPDPDALAPSGLVTDVGASGECATNVTPWAQSVSTRALVHGPAP